MCCTNFLGHPASAPGAKTSVHQKFGTQQPETVASIPVAEIETAARVQDLAQATLVAPI